MALMYKAAFALLASIIILSTAPPFSLAAPKGMVKGRVMHGGDPVAGVNVYAYAHPDGLFVNEPSATPEVSDEAGYFTMELPKGNHYIAALKKGAGSKGSLEPGDMYSFYGGNPVAIDIARPVDITLNMVVKGPAVEGRDTGGEHGGVDGVVTFEGKPLDGVTLYVYLDDKDSFRGMGYYMSPPTGVDGAFHLKMSEGTYYVLARKRMKGGVAGPLKEGDYFGWLDINPVVVHKGVMEQAELPMVRKVERAEPGGQGKTLVTGVIKDAEGNPVPFVYACLYKNPEMMDRPAFLSAPTGPDGSFKVELPLGGTFYLAARDKIGGPVEPGQMYGKYNGNPEHSVVVDTGGTVDGLEIKVELVE